GFGDFVFKTEKGDEINRAGNIEELVELLETIPEESLDYHGARNHFSNWLAARGEFDLATQFRKIKSNEFNSHEEKRENLMNMIKESQKSRGAGSVAEFKYTKKSLRAIFLRIGSGSLGGKARGLAFANYFWKETNLSEKYEDITFRVPKVAVIGTDEFDQFMDVNNLWETALSLDDNRDLEEVFLKGRLSRKLVQTLKELLKEVHYPLAIRSSSLLEDSQYQPLAGMYATYMLPNCHESDKERLSQVCEAVKRVFASTFFQEPKTLMETIVHRHEEEKMAVIIMEMVGQKHGEYFYPTFSGVAQSYNYYPVSYMQREEGIAFTAIGLGKTIVDGGQALRFSPKYPNILPQYFSIKSTIANTQNTFYALNLKNGKNPLREGEKNNLEQLHLEDAEWHGTLKYTASVICDEDGIIRDSLKNKGRRVITFSPILKFQAFPLADILQDILELCQTAMGCPVEIEFAVNMYNTPDIQDEFCLLQIKPMVVGGLQKTDYLQLNEKKDVLCSSEMALGDGIIDTIRNIICVDFDTFDRSLTRNIAKEIDVINRQMGNDNPYLLIGPGRWGTADPWLGIPVNWKQISHAKVIVELGIEELNPEPSFGSHFFQNVTSLRIGYFTLQHIDKGGDLDLDWLKSQPVKQATKFIRWIQLEEPLHIRIDGSTGEGIILKPQPKKEEIMDEEESSGI
ncbi:MAG TPA: histidine kinase, partial [Candidatus Marinimicrobia bacterium]|nr:histidine kinase [Candidatus Neomarinimicrobiota bacterium]